MNDTGHDGFDDPEVGELFDLGDAEDSEDTAASGRQRLDADYFLDKVIPDEIDWRDLVRRHPLISVGIAGGLGFLLGRAKGAAIVAGISAGLTGAVMRQLSDVFEGEVFEF
jgi:hypothetical protein